MYKLYIVGMIVLFVGCTLPSDKNDSEALPSEASGTVGSNGGIIEVTNPSSAIYGVKIKVPANAIDDGERATITINYENSLPGSVDRGIVAASKTLLVNKNTSPGFKIPVEITIPYNELNMEPNDIPGVYYWDPACNRYFAVGVSEIDTSHKMITFITTHFSKFMALAVRGLANQLTSGTLPAVDTGFRPMIDGFFHKNFRSYVTPGGNCLGMANYSIWYYAVKKAADSEGLYSKYRQGLPDDQQDDTNVRELITRAFQASSQGYGAAWVVAQYGLPEPDITMGNY